MLPLGRRLGGRPRGPGRLQPKELGEFDRVAELGNSYPVPVMLR